jgi:octaprenyl-diphosphate synthase
MNSIEKIQIPIKEDMMKFEKNLKASIKSKVTILNIITNYILRRKEDQMRPMFVFLSARLNGTVTESTYTAASLMELLHTATLVHDDVTDEFNDKSGIFSFNTLWRSKIAVLMGDYLLSKGLQSSVENKAFDLLEIVSEAVKEMSEGELLQIQRLRNMNITTDQYFEIIRKKTATLISACSASGAKSVNGDPETVKKMKLFGEYVGMSIQIKRDLLDLGNPTSKVIKEKKLTLPLIYAFENSSKDEKRHIINAINSDVKTSLKVKTITEFVKAKGGLEFASNTMLDFHHKAKEILSTYPDSEIKFSLTELINLNITGIK